MHGFFGFHGSPSVATLIGCAPGDLPPRARDCRKFAPRTERRRREPGFSVVAGRDQPDDTSEFFRTQEIKTVARRWPPAMLLLAANLLLIDLAILAVLAGWVRPG